MINKKFTILLIILLLNVGLVGFNFLLSRPQDKNVEQGQQSYAPPVLGAEEVFEGQQLQLNEILTTPPPFELGIVMLSFYKGVTYGQAKKLTKSLGLNIENRNDYWKEQGVIPFDGMPLAQGNLFKIQVPHEDEDVYVQILQSSELVKFATLNYVVTEVVE